MTHTIIDRLPLSELCGILGLDYDNQYMIWKNNNRGICSLRAQITGNFSIYELCEVVENIGGIV